MRLEGIAVPGNAANLTHVLVRRYRTRRDYELDARKLALSGYEVVSVTAETPGRGCAFIILAVLTLGLWLVLTRPRPRYVVTYRYKRG